MTRNNVTSTSRPNSVSEGKLIAALMSSESALITSVEERLAERFGTIEFRSDLFLFDAYSGYYQPEMGSNLSKKFISFTPIIAVETLPDIKQQTNAMEQEYLSDGRRRINIDPGYVTHAHLVLATTKPYSHRIYLRHGIFAELTYLCKGKEFYPLEWTYPDYREAFAREFFLRVRLAYLQQRRAQRRTEGESEREDL